MKRVKQCIVLWLLLATLAWALPDLPCPVDGLRSHFTGKTEYVGLTLMNVYRCPRGHEFLVRAR